MKLFLDANVLFTAAHNPQGKAALVIGLGSQGHWTLCTSSYALEEARRNLETKFPESLGALDAFMPDIHLGEHRHDVDFPKGLAEKDQPIFQAALACRATHLLTGDLKDFGRFMDKPDRTYGILVQTVASFLDQLG